MHSLKQNNLNLDEFAKYCAVIMSIDEANCEKILNTRTFFEICKTIFDFVPTSHKEIKSLQNEIITFSKKINSVEFNIYIHEAFDILKKNEVLENSLHTKLKKIFEFTHDKKIEETKVSFGKTDEVFDFNKKLDVLFNILKELKENIESNSLQNKILQSEQALKNRSFSIGITGVMNAGKSTLLNALMKADILGTAVIPETANLSIIKYSKEKHAVVNFWDKSEWKEIEKSANSIASMKEFVENTNKIFGKNMSEFVQDNSLKQKIKIDELANYTSAVHSNGKCNLVKSVELYTDLEFLEDGVVIVDTPGLDDPVIQREEITKKYLSHCDLMMHLMNVSQSATAKDIEFIIDALTYQGISKLLIVLTRIDAITKDELEEVKNYTKNSIRLSLEKQNRGTLFNSIIQKLEFIPISGKLALMHRLGLKEEALKLGFTEEQTGITKIEKYLHDTLFGANSEKATLLLNSNAKILYSCANESAQLYLDEKNNLSKSSEELKEILKTKELQNKNQNENIDKILSQITSAKNELENYANTILLEIPQRVNSLKNKIHSRVHDDVKYELIKNKKKPTDERISYFIDIGIKDGLLDIIRDCRFNFSKKSDTLNEKIASILDDSEFSQIQNSFDVKSFFDLHKNSISTNFSTLINDTLNAIKKCTKSTLDEFSVNLDELLIDTFEKIKFELKEVLKSLNTSLIIEFAKNNEEPIELKKMMLHEEIENLKKQIILTEKDAKSAKLRIESLGNKISILNNLKELLQNYLR